MITYESMLLKEREERGAENTARVQLHSANAKINRQREELKRLNEQVKTLKQEYKSKENAYTEEINAFKRSLLYANSKIWDLTKSLDKAQSTIEHQSKKLESVDTLAYFNMQEQIASLNNALRVSNERHTSLQIEYDKKLTYIQELEKKLSEKTVNTNAARYWRDAYMTKKAKCERVESDMNSYADLAYDKGWNACLESITKDINKFYGK